MTDAVHSVAHCLRPGTTAGDFVADLMAQALESSRPITVASSLVGLGEIFREEGPLPLAVRCLRTALAIYRDQGSRRASVVETRLAEVRAAHPEVDGGEDPGADPLAAARTILAELREGRPETVLA